MLSAMRTAERQRSYKKGIDGEITRRRRDETTTQIRKSIKEGRLNQRRRMSSSGDVNVNNEMDFDQNIGMDLASAIESSQESGLNNPPFNLPRITAMIQSRNVKEQTYAVSTLRRMLSMQNNPPIQGVVNLGVVPLLVTFLQRHDIPELQFEAAWALTNIASGTTQHTEVVINSGAVPLFCELLLSNNDDVCEQAVWALGNISGDSPACRDYVLSSGTMAPLLALLRRSVGKISILRNATWTLSNLCRGKPQPEFSLVQPALAVLPHLIYSPDEEVITDACWALSYLSDGTNERVQAVLDAGILRRIVDLLGHTLVATQTPALRIVGNIVSGNERQTQVALDCGILAQLLPLTKHPKKLIRKETCWTISNVTAGTIAQIQEVIDANVIPPLIHQLTTSEFDVQKEAAWAISNATSSGTHAQIKYLVEQGCIPPLVHLLTCSDPAIIIVCLDALLKILKVGEYDCGINEENKMKLYIEEADGITRIQDLQYHAHEDVYQKALFIIQEYFDGDEDDTYALEPGFDPESGQFAFNGAFDTHEPFNFQ